MPNQPLTPPTTSSESPLVSGGGANRLEFLRAQSPKDPHRDRAQGILRDHPEVREHIGTNAWTFWIILGIVTFQVVMAAVVSHRPWWVIFLVALLPGAIASHTLWVTIHECTHNLVFRSRAGNHIAGIVSNLPHVFPTSVLFGRYHSRHHMYLGVYELDADLPYRWEARFVGNSPWRKAVWIFFTPIMQSMRPARLREIKPIDRWVVLNFAAQILFDVGIWWFLGPGALWYLFASFFMGLGLHPLGARWVQEHYVFFPGQATSSYYGPANRVALNIGYHNEHHDFPSVPWNRLRALHEAAPEAYDSLGSHRSYTRLLLRFILDPTVSLFSREVRPRPGEVRVNDETNHDVQLIEDSGRPVAPSQTN